MAQSKLNDLAGKFGKGGPPGLATGLKLLAAVGAAAYGINNSMFTGKAAVRNMSGSWKVFDVSNITFKNRWIFFLLRNVSHGDYTI